jgi:DNA-binding SARP family transcriptional activator
MDFRLLGPVEVFHDGSAISLGGSKPRALLAALLLQRGRVVSVHRLVDVLWGDNPPPTATGLVQTYVSGLRRQLRQTGRDEVIHTRPPGYAISADADEVDVAVFARLAEDGRRAAADGDHERALELFERALALWRGPALGDLADSTLDVEARRLDEARLAVLEERAAIDLALGNYAALVHELTPAVASYSGRETLRRHLMVALYGMDRQADALAVFREGRRILIEEYGVEPGPALTAAHEAILRSERDILAPPPVPVPSNALDSAVPWAAARPPAQLPSIPADFTGRSHQLRELVARLSTDPSRSGVPICVVSGNAGVGKSTLAIRVAHELAADYPDGQLFAQLHGTTDTPVATEVVLARFLTGLGLSTDDLPPTVEERAEAYRSLLAGRRVLVVIDDAGSEKQVRPLLPGHPGCGVLVTTRGRLGGLAGADQLELDVLDENEAEQLLARIAGEDRVAAEPAAAQQLVRHSARLPLAVRIIGVRLATRRHWRLAQLSDRLADETRRLDELSVGDQQVRAALAVSYHALEPTGRTALRRLGLLGLPDFPIWLVGALLDEPESTAYDAIEQLLDAHLLTYAGSDGAGQVRYQMHDLMRIYAGEQANLEDDHDARAAAVTRALTGWLRLIDTITTGSPTGGLLLRSHRITGIGPPRPEPGPWLDSAVKPAILDPQAWFAAEHHALVTSVERAAALDLDEIAAELASVLSGSLFAVNNMFDAWTRTHEAAISAAGRAANKHAEATLLAEFGQLRYKQDRFAEARTYFMQALAAFREYGEPRGEAATLAALATANHEQGYLPEALHFFGLADAVFRQLGDEAAIAYTSRLVGLVQLDQGELAAASERLTAALATFRRIGSRRGEAMTLRTVGLAHRAVGDYQRAYEVSEQARGIFHELGDELLEAYSIRSASKALLRLGCAGEAFAPLEEAVQTCRRLGDRWGEAMTLRTLGEAHLAERRWPEAERDLRAAIRIWQAIDLPLNRARTLRDLADTLDGAGDAAAAATVRAEAIETFRLYGVREFAELTGRQPAG